MLVLVTAALGYVFLRAWTQIADGPLATYGDLVLARAAEVVIASWLFFIGAAIGSFLNVLAWRLPRGGNVSGRSHCPWCDSALSWSDNFPVFGWLILGGRCRHCRLPISPRYPIVEAAVGLSVAAVAMTTVLNDATNLPFWPKRFGYRTALWTPSLGRDSMAVLVYHIVALSCLWAVALIRYDGHRLPRRLVASCFALLALPMLAYPTLAVVPWSVNEVAQWTAQGQYLGAMMRLATGLAAAVVLARLLGRWLCPDADPKLNPLGEQTARLLDLIALLGLVGMVIGWQGLIGLTTIAVLGGRNVAARLLPTRDRLGQLAITLPGLLTMQLVFWDDLHRNPWWPSVNTAPGVTLGWVAAVIVLSPLTRPATDRPAPRTP